jgi:hypothetical protein
MGFYRETQSVPGAKLGATVALAADCPGQFGLLFQGKATAKYQRMIAP